MIYSDLKIVATGLQQNDVLSNTSNLIYVNPIIYKEIMSYYNPSNPGDITLNFITPNYKITSPSKYNHFAKENGDILKKELSKSFSNLKTDKMVTSKVYSSTPYNSFNTQVMMYNILTWSISVILMLVITFVFFFIQSYSIKKNKDKLIFLKSLGIGRMGISYYITISIIPLLILAGGIGLAVSIPIYSFFNSTIGASVGFQMSITPSTTIGYYIFIGLLITLVLIVAFVSYLNINGEKLSILSKAKLSNITLWLMKIKNYRIIKIFNGGIYTSFEIVNLFKSFTVLIISFCILTVVGLSFQFITSIDNATTTFDNRVKKTKNTESISYQDLELGQKEVGNFTDQNFKEYMTEIPKFDFSSDNVQKEFTSWISKLEKINPRQSYFNQLKEFLDFYSNNRSDFSFSKKITELLDQALVYYEDYKSVFGRESLDPIITFGTQPRASKATSPYLVHSGTYNNVQIRAYAGIKSKENITDIEISYSMATLNDLHVGDKIHIDFGEKINDTYKKSIFKISNIDYDIFDNNEVIVNEALFEDTKYIPNNAWLTTDRIPYDLQFLTIPIIKKDATGNYKNGMNFNDYFEFSKPYTNFNIDFTSFPLISNSINAKTKPFKELMMDVSIFLIILSIIIVFTISMIISLENEKAILILKTLGYNVNYVIKILTTTYAVSILVGLIGSIFLSIKLLSIFSPMILSKLGIIIEPDFNIFTLGISIMIAIILYFAIFITITMTYKRKNVLDIMSF